MLDFDDFFENIAKFAMMDEMEIFDIGKTVAQIADVDEDAEEVLGLGGFGWSGGFAENGEN